MEVALYRVSRVQVPLAAQRLCAAVTVRQKGTCPGWGQSDDSTSVHARPPVAAADALRPVTADASAPRGEALA